MLRLTDIIWPVIMEMTKQEISEHAKTGKPKELSLFVLLYRFRLDAQLVDLYNATN